MEAILPFAFLCFTSIFTINNPLGIMPVFLTMTKDLSESQREGVLRRATLISFITLMAFIFTGQFLFSFFGISANGFRIAAGIIILKIGYDMLNAKIKTTKLSEEEMSHYAKDIAITPLSIPMLCGPGAIANGIMLMDQAKNIERQAVLVGSVVVVYMLCYVILHFSTRLLKWLGETGNMVMMRLMGLILMVLAVECFVGGIRPILTDIISVAVN